MAASLPNFAMLIGCDAFVALDAPETVIASCGRSSGIPEGTQINVEQQLRTDNLRARVIPSRDIRQDKAFEINRCIEATVMGNSALPDVAGVPRRVETVRTLKSITDSYTYGTPPAPATTPTASQSGMTSRPRQCNLQMTGGSGYRCVNP